MRISGSSDYAVQKTDRIPELWDPVTGNIKQLADWQNSKGRWHCYFHLAANESVFIVFRKSVKEISPFDFIHNASPQDIDGPWTVHFDTSYGGPAHPVLFKALISWTIKDDSLIRYYSGTATYVNQFNIYSKGVTQLVIDSVYDIATVKINGKVAGTLWTPPYILDISSYIKEGENKVEIEVANTWTNRLIGDQRLPAEKRVTWTTAPIRLSGKPLLPSGIIGKVRLILY